MLYKTLIFIVIVASAPAFAVNKCVDSQGKVIYQSAPCPQDTKSDTLTVNTKPPTAVETQSGELDHIKEQGKKFERERRLMEIDREIKLHEDRSLDYRSTMNNEMAALRYKKQYANNNLAGAVWEQSISEEMSAVAKKYDALINNEQNAIEHLRKEAEELRRESKP